MKSKSNFKGKYIYMLLKRNFLTMLMLVLPLFLMRLAFIVFDVLLTESGLSAGTYDVALVK